MKAILLDEAKKWLEENCENQYTRMAVFGIMQSMPAVDYQETPNEPLTLEELSLFNAPVWIKRIDDEDLSGDGWAIVEGPRCLTWHNRIPISREIRVWWPGSEVEDFPKYENYSKTWLAYRRPPEGEEDT